MAITYDAPSNTITVTGYSELTSCDLTDIYNADVAGGWGVVTRQCANQFCFSANLKIGDGSTTTFFADENKQVIFTASPTNKSGEGVDYNWNFLQKANSNIRLGKVENAGDKTTSSGCSIIFNASGHSAFGTCLINSPATAKMELYSTSITSISGYVLFLFGQDGCKIYNCFLPKGIIIAVYKNADFFNLTLENGIYGLSEVTGTLDKLYITHCTDALTMGADAISDSIIQNAIFLNNTYLVYFSNPAYNIYLIDCEVDVWNFTHAGSHTKKTYRQHKFNTFIIDELKNPHAGKSWTLKDKNGATQYSGTTQADGRLAATDIVVTHGYYNQAGGNVEYEAAPYALWIDGETDYLDLDELDLRMDEKNVNGELTMVNVSDLIDGIDDLKGTGFTKDVHSLTDIEERTTNLPDDPADQSLVEAAISTRAPAAEYDTVIAALQTDLTFVRDEAGGKWEIVGDQMIFFKEDATELMRFNLFNASGNPAVSDVMKRERVL